MKYYKSERINQFNFEEVVMWYLLFIREIPYPLTPPDEDSDTIWWQGVSFSPAYSGVMIKTDPGAWEECTEEEFIENAEKLSADRIALTYKSGNKVFQAKAEAGKDSDPKQD